MARFRYLGEPARSYVTTYGPTTAIRVRPKTGSPRTLTPISPATAFVPGVDIGYDITDTRELRFFQNDPRFAEI